MSGGGGGETGVLRRIIQENVCGEMSGATTISFYTSFRFSDYVTLDNRCDVRPEVTKACDAVSV
jgi:hypothetical protein